MNMFHAGRFTAAAVFLGSNNMFAMVLAFVALASFSTTYTAQSYTVPRHGLSHFNIIGHSLNPACIRRSGLQGDDRYIIGTSTRLQSSYQQPPSSDGKESNVSKSAKDLNLYEVLGARQTATRSELKRQYVKLAKVSHPDAQIGGMGDDSVDFQQVTEAWRILGNPKSRKRYDRDLKAKEWGEKAQRITNEGLEQVAPVASKIMDNVAVPFLRTTSKTFAFGKKIATGFGAMKEPDESASSQSPPAKPSTTVSPPPFSPTAPSTNTISSPSRTTIETKNVTGIVDDKRIEQNVTTTTASVVEDTSQTEKKADKLKDEQIETIKEVNATISVTEEKNSTETLVASEVDEFVSSIETGKGNENPNDLNKMLSELQEKAKEEEEKGKHIFEELDSVKEKRLFGTVQSSDLTLTSTEAVEVLEKLNSADSVSYINRGMKKTAIEKDILSLRNTEIKFTEKLESYTEIDREWNAWLAKQEEAKQNLTQKRMKEIEAQKALVDAQQMVVEAKDKMVSVTNTLRGVEQEVRKSAQEMDRVSTTLSKKQEKVQNALRRKMDLMKGGIQVEYITEKEVMLLRKKESQLIGESKQIATMVARLQARADKLKQRADALEQWRNN